MALAGAPKIDQIEILSLIGQGGMSCVFKGRQTTLDRIVAVKLLKLSNANSDSSIKRFQQEAKITSLLDHPNIARTLTYGISQDGQPYLVMEYLQGSTLSQELEKTPVLKYGRFKEIFIPILSALEAAHKAGLVHRDIKPANIMLSKTDDGAETVKLLDFGVARVFQSDSDSSQKLTEVGSLIGSPMYMSPEQCRADAVDGRSDLYSLACVMYESLCGNPPFAGDSALELMNHHLHTELVSTKNWCKTISLPEPLARAILHGLSKDPNNRPQSAAEYSQELLKALDSLSLERSPQLKKQKRTKPTAFLVAGAALLICMGLLAYQKYGNEQKRDTGMLTDKIGLTTLGLEALYEKADQHNAQKQFLQELQERNEIINLLKKHQRTDSDKCKLSEAYYKAALCAFSQSELLKKEKTKYLEIARELSKTAVAAARGHMHDRERYIQIVSAEINYLFKLNRLKEAEELIDREVLSTANDAHEGRIGVLFSAGTLYMGIANNPKKTEELCRSVMKTLDRNSNDYLGFSTLLAQALLRQNKKSEAAQVALDFIQILKSTNEVPQNKLVEYDQFIWPVLVSEHPREFLDLSRESLSRCDAPIDRYKILILVANTHSQSKDYDAAIDALLKAKAELNKCKNDRTLDDEKAVLKSLIDSYKSKHDSRNALKTEKELAQLK